MSMRLIVLLTLCCCAGKQSAARVTATPAPAQAEAPTKQPEPPGLRLSTNVLPTHYAVELHLDPSQSTFTGARSGFVGSGFGTLAHFR